jgi:hypothetical protein
LPCLCLASSPLFSIVLPSSQPIPFPTSLSLHRPILSCLSPRLASPLASPKRTTPLTHTYRFWILRLTILNHYLFLCLLCLEGEVVVRSPERRALLRRDGCRL